MARTSSTAAPQSKIQAWARKVKNYLNAKMRGMKVILEKVETDEEEFRPESTSRIHCNGHDATEVAE